MRSIEAGKRIEAGKITEKLVGEFSTGWGKFAKECPTLD